MFEKFTWKITNFSKLNNVEKIYSEPFVLGGYLWRILLNPKWTKKENNLSIFLVAMQMMKTDNVFDVWNRDVKFNLILFNQLNTNRTVTKGECNSKFDANNTCWGWDFSSLVTFAELLDPEKGFIVNDICIVGAEVSVCESTLENQVNRTVILADPINGEVSSTNDDLQVSWEQLKKYRSDMTWLEAHVQSALEVKNYVEKALSFEKWKENETDLGLETEKLKTKLIGKS